MGFNSGFKGLNAELIRDQEAMLGYVSHPRVRECGHVPVLLLGAGGPAVCQPCISAGNR